MIELIKRIIQIIKEEKKTNAEIREVHVRIVQLKEMELDKKQELIDNYGKLTLFDEIEIEQDILNIQKIILQKQKDMINFRSK